jgi:hypothetical protein
MYCTVKSRPAASFHVQWTTCEYIAKSLSYKPQNRTKTVPAAAHNGAWQARLAKDDLVSGKRLILLRIICLKYYKV